MKLFTIRNLLKVYNGRNVLDIERLELDEGKIYSLYGPNGSGKTTFLEILGMLSSPTKGYMEYRGKPIKFNGMDLKQMRKQIVLVQQNPVLFSTSVYKNMEFPLKVRKVSVSNRNSIIEECLDLVGMKDFIHAHAPNLSSGEKQRVAIARALACSPDVLLLDEPTANVDAENQVTVENIISDIKEQKGISIILTTHDLIQAERVADEIIPLFKGRLAPTVYENLFDAAPIKDTKGREWLILKRGIKIPFKSNKTERLRISIDPFRVVIMGRGEIKSMLGIFKGRIVQMTKEKRNIRFLVDIGLPINIIMKEGDVKARQFFVGDDVCIEIPDSSIHILSAGRP